jgi:uncharacterized protein (DUF433 family)
MWYYAIGFQANVKAHLLKKHPLLEEIVRFERITADPNQLGGLPCLRGLRIPVSRVVGMLADGMTEAEILHYYPDLELEDIRESLRFAAAALEERQVPLIAP